MITLGVKNLETSCQFYEKGLGWKKSAASQGDIVFFELGNLLLALFPRHELAKDIGIPDQGSGFGGTTLSYNAKDEVEVDQVMHEAQHAGARILKAPQKVFWGGYSGYFADPDGHIVEVAHNPFWQLDSEGNVVLN